MILLNSDSCDLSAAPASRQIPGPGQYLNWLKRISQYRPKKGHDEDCYVPVFDHLVSISADLEPGTLPRCRCRWKIAINAVNDGYWSWWLEEEYMHVVLMDEIFRHDGSMDLWNAFDNGCLIDLWKIRFGMLDRLIADRMVLLQWKLNLNEL